MNASRPIQTNPRSFGTIRGTRSHSSSCYQTVAECLLHLGRLARFLVRHGGEVQQVATELGVGDKLCRLAISLAAAPDRLKVRALVEGWNVLRIRSEVRQIAG